MGKIYVLVGASSTGKSSVEKIMASKGFIRTISHTTREPRENEVDGMDYYFTKRQTFYNMALSKQFVETEIYKGWHYGLAKSEVDLSKGNHVCVATPRGLKAIRDYYGEENVVGIYLYISNKWELLKRMLDRQPNATEEQCKEMCRRFLSDFDTMAEAENLCILKINNINLADTVDIIIRNINNGM